MIFGIATDSDINQTSTTLTLYGDVNGVRSPNEGGTDLCKYIISNLGTLTESCYISFATEEEEETPPGDCSWSNLAACDKAACEALPIIHQGSGHSKANFKGAWCGGACTKRNTNAAKCK